MEHWALSLVECIRELSMIIPHVAHEGALLVPFFILLLVRTAGLFLMLEKIGIHIKCTIFCCGPVARSFGKEGG